MAEVNVIGVSTANESMVSIALSTNANWTAAATGLYVDMDGYRDGEVALLLKMTYAATTTQPAGKATVTVYDGNNSTAGGFWRGVIGNLSFEVTLPEATGALENPAMALMPFTETARFKDKDGYVYFDVGTSNSTGTEVVGIQIPKVAP